MIRITKDSRTLRTGADYTKFRREVYADQCGHCIECGQWTSLQAEIESDYSFHLAHIQTRGMGGAFRDDVVGTRKGQVAGGKCGRCHRQEHGQCASAVGLTATRLESFGN